MLYVWNGLDIFGKVDSESGTILCIFAILYLYKIENKNRIIFATFNV